MKVLHYSDRAEPNLRSLFEQAELLITTGDLTIFDFASIRSSLDQKPAFGVYGNHDTPGYLEKLGIINLHLKVYEWAGYTFGGYQGSVRYKRGGGPQFTEEQAYQELKNYSAVDVLLLHAAPKDMLDTPDDDVHQGSQAVREYVLRTNPKYIFCGHDSPTKTEVFGQIKVFRTHQSRVVEIE
ncbi:MAG: hypothetical protein GF381_01515 [Candidatus Pacebacteria bacterium]|nr:hypothetical protein [Candidatus Paceibacterota bacterium]